MRYPPRQSHRLFCAALAIFLASSTPAARCADSDVPPKLDSAIVRGLDFLEAQQTADGAFEKDGPRLATAGLSLMAFMAAGHEPDVGRYGNVVRNALNLLVKIAPDDGYFGKIDNSRMYGQGIITLALAEAYGLESDLQRREKLRAVLTRAVSVILAAQRVQKPPPHTGGWRYEPSAADSDISLSGWNALALRAAGAAGIDVPKESTDQATDFIVRCWREDLQRFCYQPGGEGSAASNAVGILSLHLLDAAAKMELAKAARSLAAKSVDERFPYYSKYYATQAAHQLDDAAWKAVAAPILGELIIMQQADGGWPVSAAGQEPGRVYATSMALLTLTVSYQLLPVYQK